MYPASGMVFPKLNKSNGATTPLDEPPAMIAPFPATPQTVIEGICTQRWPGFVF